jgi:uncharacterized membrane protein
MRRLTPQTTDAVDDVPAAMTTSTDESARPDLRIGPLRLGRIDGWLVVVIAVAAVVRFWGLGRQGLWYDEWLTTEALAGSFSDLFRHVAEREGITPTYFALVYGWAEIFGDSEAALRSISALAGIATVPVVYATTRELGQRRVVARVAALIVAINPMLVWYSQEARPYSILAFLASVTLLALARVLHHRRSGDFLFWGVACAATVVMHYHGIFLVAAEAVALLLLCGGRRRSVLLSCVPTVLAVASLAPFALRQRSHRGNWEWIETWPLSYRLREAERSALIGPNAPDDRLWILALVAVVLAAVLLIWLGESEARRVAGIMAGLSAAAVAMPLVMGALGFDLFLGRYLIAALIPMIIAVAIGLTVERARWVGAIGLALWVAVSLTAVIGVARDPYLQRPRWRSVANVHDFGRPQSLLVMNRYGYLGSPLRYYLENARPLDEHEVVAVDEIDVLMSKQPWPKRCDLLVGTSCFYYLGGPLPEPLASQFHVAGRVDLEQFSIVRYQANGPVPVSKAQLVKPDEVRDSLVLAPAP